MEHFALLRMLHGVAGVLLFVAFFALAGFCWRGRSRLMRTAQVIAETEAGVETAQSVAETPAEAEVAATAEPETPPRTSAWPVLCAVLLLLCLIGLPVSGWWLAHLAGWPLGQPWLLGSSLLFLPGAICGLWLAARVAGRSAGARLGLGLALVGVSCFAAILGLMVIKPV
ncbi:DUF2269 family protein [Azotobacter salinestris]|uniref:DUF2269 family protein n=1 Tax=Azotobacter salinestris TaxID=69964 RepID=UPI001266ACA7|nr:DUF2269 family protein [Azotobacter salinestris]